MTGGFGGITSRFDLFKPIIARVNGFALGGGLEMALACDIIVAADHAEVGLPEPRRGLIAGAMGVHRLPRQLPLKQAMGYMLTGRHIPAQRAYEIGLVNEVVPLAKLDDAVAAWVADIVRCAPLSVRATKEAARAQYAGLGRQIVARAFERAGKPFSDDALKRVLSRLARPSVDDVFVAVGRGEMFSGDVVKAVHPEFKDERKVAPAVDKKESGWFNFKNVSRLMFRAPSGDPDKAVPIRGLRGDLPVRFAPNGGAVPGDRIVGIITPGDGITIYPIQSPALSAFDNEPERWIDVRWDLEEYGRDKFPAQIKVTAINEPGSLGVIASVIGDAGANIANIAFEEHSPDFRDVLIDVEVNDLKHLTGIISQLKAKPVVSKVERING